MVGMLLEPGYGFRGGRIVTEPTAAHVASFTVDGRKREAYSLGASEHFALPRLRPAAGADGVPAPAPLTDVGVYLGWFGRATRLVHYGSALTTAGQRACPACAGALDAAAGRIQRSRAAPGPARPSARTWWRWRATPSGKELAAVHLTGGDPYSFTAAMLAWAAGKAAADGVRPAGALGPVEAFGVDSLESACADAGFQRERAALPATLDRSDAEFPGCGGRATETRYYRT